jgi:hypothetical protein
MKRSIALAIAISFGASIPALAQTTSASGEFSLQGRLSTTAGNAVANGQHSVMIRVYQSGSSTPVYTETDVVTTIDGVFSTMVGDNGSGGELRFDAAAEYELGITVDGETELLPRLQIGESPRATTADVALDAKAVAGFGVSTDGSAQPNTLVTLNGEGQINASLLANSTVTSINGVRGDVNIEGGGDLAVNRNGSTIALSFTGAGGGLSLPFSDSSSFGAGQTGLSITSTGAGSAATFVNTSTGTALNLQGSAGAALSATGAATTDAVVRIQNTSSGASARLISALDASGNAAFSVAANGQTTIRSTVGNALDVSTSAAGEAALRVTGGLSLNGPIGTASIAAGEGTVVVSNAYARANSVILLTVNNAIDAVPLRVVSQGTGTFTVGLTSALIGQITGAVSFSYLIVNQ